MATTVAQVNVVAGADISRALAGLGSLNRAVGRTGGFFRIAAGTAAGFIGGTLGLQAIRSVANEAGGAMIGLNSTLDQQRLSFSQLLGSGEAGAAFLDQLATFADRTVFSLTDVTGAARSMLTAGFSLGEIIPTLTNVAGAVQLAGGNADTLNRLTRAFVQMATAGVVHTEELNQVADTGVPAFQILASALGKSTEQTRKLVEANNVPAQTFVKAFNQWAQLRGLPALVDDAQNHWQGAWSTFSDTTRRAIATATLPLFRFLERTLVKAAAAVQTPGFRQWVMEVQSAFAGMIPTLQAGLDWLIANGPKAWEWLRGTIPGALEAIRGAWQQMQQAVATFRTTWQELQPTFEALRNWLADVLPPAAAQLGDAFTAIRAALVPVLPAVAALTGAFVQMTAPAVTDVLKNDLVPALIGIGAAVAVLQVPALIAAAGAFVTMAAAAAPLLLLAAAAGALAFVIAKNWPAIKDTITDVVNAVRAKLLELATLVQQARPFLQGLLTLSVGPGQAGAILGQLDTGIARLQAIPNLPAPGTSGGGGSAFGGGLNVNIDTLNASNPSDVDTFLARVRAAAEAAQAQMEGFAPVDLVGAA